MNAVKFEFNDIKSLASKNDSLRRLYVLIQYDLIKYLMILFLKNKFILL